MFRQVAISISRRYYSLRNYATTLTGRTTSPNLPEEAPSIPSPAARVPKKEGTIQDLFTSLTTESQPLPDRFLDLKKQVFRAKLVESWREVLEELDVVTKDVISRGTDVIPQVCYADLEQGLSPEQIKAVKQTGTIIVKGGVPPEEALAWKQSVRDYVEANAGKVKGIPPESIVFYEIYNAKAQIAARTHPALINTQRALLSLWHASDPSTPVSLSTPIAYFDRLRIRPPGPSVFTLGPHIDGGGIERWEDPGYRTCFSRIFEGRWKEHDPFDVTPRLDANQDLYHAPNQCTVFRPWQGWTSLSTTGPREGTLRLLPFLSAATAYIMLRPFFRLRSEFRALSGPIPLEADAWEVNLETSEFPGSEMGKTQALREWTHPHLRLDKAMISIPKVEPGDQVYWHCDLPHAVEAEHVGAGDSSVFYIPAVPITLGNAGYLRDQLAHFKKGLPSPDFPGGEGETTFKGRSTPEDIRSAEGRKFVGLAPYDIPAKAPAGAASVIKQANSILFGA